MPIPRFYTLQREAATSPRLQQSSVSPESRERDDEPGTLRWLRSKIFPCYRQLTLPCKTSVPVSSGAQKEHSSRPGSTSITADAQEGAQCNLHAERHLKMSGKRKQQTITHRGFRQMYIEGSRLVNLIYKWGRFSHKRQACEARQQGRI